MQQLSTLVLPKQREIFTNEFHELPQRSTDTWKTCFQALRFLIRYKTFSFLWMTFTKSVSASACSRCLSHTPHCSLVFNLLQFIVDIYPFPTSHYIQPVLAEQILHILISDIASSELFAQGNLIHQVSHSFWKIKISKASRDSNLIQKIS